MSFSNPNYTTTPPPGYTSSANNYYYGGNSQQQYPHPKPVVIVTNAYGIQVHQSDHHHHQQQLPHQQFPQSQHQQQIQQQQQQHQHQQQQEQLFDDEANAYTRSQYNKKNQPQSNSVTSACMIASTGGINVTYIYAYITSYYPFIDNVELLHTLLSWFIGVIVGSIISGFLVRQIRKKIFNYIASILTIASGIIFIIDHNNNYTMIILARYICGIAYGIILIPFLMHSSEISVKKLRGSLVSNFQICFTIGVLLGGFYYSFFSSDLIQITLDIHQLTGIALIIFGVFAFFSNIFLTIESPLYLIDKNLENDAFQILMKLRSEKFEIPRRKHEFDDIKDMYNEDILLSSIPFRNRNIRPLLMIGILRCLYQILTSIPLNFKLIASFEPPLSYKFSELFLMVRMCGEIVGWFMIDRKGRRHILSSSMLLCGVCTIIIGLLFNETIQIQYSISILSLFFQFFLGLGFGLVSLTYMAEAFPYVKKSYSLLLIIIFENFINILLIWCFIYDYFNFYYITFFFSVGVITIMYSFLIFNKLPETKNLTLRQCRNIMR